MWIYDLRVETFSFQPRQTWFNYCVEIGLIKNRVFCDHRSIRTGDDLLYRVFFDLNDLLLPQDVPYVYTQVHWHTCSFKDREPIYNLIQDRYVRMCSTEIVDRPLSSLLVFIACALPHVCRLYLERDENRSESTLPAPLGIIWPRKYMRLWECIFWWKLINMYVALYSYHAHSTSFSFCQVAFTWETFGDCEYHFKKRWKVTLAGDVQN